MIERVRIEAPERRQAPRRTIAPAIASTPALASKNVAESPFGRGLHAAMIDDRLFGPTFGVESFWTWRTVAKLLDGLPLDRRELKLFRECTGRSKPPKGGLHRLILLVGRRGGKDRFLSAVAGYRALLASDWPRTLSPGETAVVQLLGKDKAQGAILYRYCRGLVLSSTILADQIIRDTQGGIIEFTNGAAIEIGTNDVGALRGRSSIGVLGTECCFWRTDSDHLSSDEEIVLAAEPAMAMDPTGGVLIMASSTYRKRGWMYKQYQSLFGNDSSDDVVWLAPSRVMNPVLRESFIQKAIERDGSKAAAEYLSIWREDIADFLPLDIVEAATDRKIIERPPKDGIRYFAFTDAAGGSGADSFTLAIGHHDREADRLVLDAMRERKPRFAPAEVVNEYSVLLKQYRCSDVSGDRFAGSFHADEWTRRGIQYRDSTHSKSEIYLAALPLLMNGRARLLDSERLRSQLTGLERRVGEGGREHVDHSPGQHDDLCNSVCGLLVHMADMHTNQPRAALIAPSIISDGIDRRPLGHPDRFWNPD
ncbi:MAG: hypothetical protein E5X72_09670 [Mesorhizobium sp.]|uniref:hypothetical protein n=1 Tax=Mesorhizobium sp. TaxID=1871066 RepID=UPI001218BC25|nr:hypothetical protein [Mesorhizobium sp.]TIP04938.1 MAG: hypothetical protein E5X72_09670 [Mesorhizobium sp.]